MTEILQLIILWVVVLGMALGGVALAVFYAKKWWGVVSVLLIAIGCALAVGLAVMVGSGSFLSYSQDGYIEELRQFKADHTHTHIHNASASNKAIMVKQASAANVNFNHFNRLIEAATARIEKLEKVMPLTLNMSTLSNRAVLVETQK